MYKTALVFGLVLVVAAAGLFFYGPEASAPVLPAPDESPESLKATSSDSVTETGTSTDELIQNETPKPPIIKPVGTVHTATIENMSFEPVSLTVKAGDIVAWTNKDSATHTVTGKGFDSGNLKQGDSFAFRFEKAGTYSYSCTLHPNMKGTVIVR